MNILTLSKIVDHIVPIYVRPDWRLALGNTQVLCDPCHKRKTSADIRKYGHRSGPLTPEQIANREQANQLEQPPRDDGCMTTEGNRWGGSYLCADLAAYQTLPETRFSAKLGRGGSEG